MHSSSLVAELFSNRVISDVDIESIEAQQTDVDRADVWLDIMARKSDRAYDKLIKALKDSGHRQIAETLEGLELKARLDLQFRDDIPADQRIKIIKVVNGRMEEALVSGKTTAIN